MRERPAVVQYTAHGLTFEPPPTMRGGGRHDYHAASLPLLVARTDGELVGPLPYEHGKGCGWPALRRTQLATWTAYAEVGAVCGLRPGAHIVETVPPVPDACGPRPIAADSGGPLDDWRHLGWRDARSGGAPVRLSVDPADVTDGAVIVDTLRARHIAWTRPVDSWVPDVITVDPALIRRVGRRGVAMVERGDTPVVRDLDPATLLCAAARRVGPTRFAAFTGTTRRTAKHLAEGRRPNAQSVRRLLARFQDAGPQTLARFLDELDAGTPSCAHDGCNVPVGTGARYCTREHAQAARRERDAARKRRQRAEASS